MMGKYGGAPAVVKLFGPDCGGLAAYDRELQVYHKLETLQGQVVPCLLGAGHLTAGVRYLAVARVEGPPLSGLPQIGPAVAAAAVCALGHLHSSHVGFLHGDIRLQNVMLARGCTAVGAGGAGSADDTDVRCMFIDFGQSQLGGSIAEQHKEVKLLKHLMGA